MKLKKIISNKIIFKKKNVAFFSSSSRSTRFAFSDDGLGFNHRWISTQMATVIMAIRTYTVVCFSSMELINFSHNRTTPLLALIFHLDLCLLRDIL